MVEFGACAILYVGGPIFGIVREREVRRFEKGRSNEGEKRHRYLPVIERE